MKLYFNNFGFLYCIRKLQAMQDDKLIRCYNGLQFVLSNECSCTEFFCENKNVLNFNSQAVIYLQALAKLKKTCGSFTNITIALQIMLTIPVTSAGVSGISSYLIQTRKIIRP